MNPARKNDGPFLAFDKQWFQNHQKSLLWFLQFKWFRKVLRIDTKLPIVAIHPNSYICSLGGDEYQADFRTHAKFAKRLYFAFKPLWWAMHYWDEIFADRYVPKWSFGFLTLTAFPDADNETTTVDGEAYHDYGAGTSNNWTTIRAAAGTSSDDALTSGRVEIFSTNQTNSWRRLVRMFTLFDTSALTSSATISAAVLSMYGQNGDGKADNLSITPDIGVSAASPATNTAIASSDYANVSNTDFATVISYASINTNAYNALNFNATGIAAISKTGVSKFAVRNSNYDISGVAPSWSSAAQSFAYFYLADQTGTSNDPKFVVTYTISVNSTLTAATGTFTYTGVAALFHIAVKIAAGAGSYTLTGISVALSIGKSMVAAVGSFVLGGAMTSFVVRAWTGTTKNTSTASGTTKNNSSWSGTQEN